jgi:hypothetical protein
VLALAALLACLGTTTALAHPIGATKANSFKVQSVASINTASPSGSGKVDVTVTTSAGTRAKTAESPPPPESLPPPPPSAARCTMTPIFLTIERGHKRKAHAKLSSAQLRVTVTCTDNANVKLAGGLTAPVGKRPKHGKQRMKTYSLGPSTATVAKDVGTVVALKLPLYTVVALMAKAKESVKVTLDATSTDGPSHNSVSIKQLKA